MSLDRKAYARPAGMEAGASTYVNSLTRPGGFLPVAVSDRVEILRGPFARRLGEVEAISPRGFATVRSPGSCWFFPARLTVHVGDLRRTRKELTA